VSNHEANLRKLARVLSEISHTLETSEDCKERVERCLMLAQQVVPGRRCALLEVHGDVTKMYVAPPEDVPERERLRDNMIKLYRLVAVGDEIGRSANARPSLALPVMGLEEIIGVIRVEADEDCYEAMHLRILSVIAAQLGAYLAMVRLRDRDLARTRELEAAHDFQRLFAGVVGHDLRNPLAVISTVASMLLESTTDARHTHALERALRNVEHASRLINDLVDVTESRVSGMIRIEPQDADYGEVIGHVIDDLRRTHPNRTIELDVPRHMRVPGVFDAMRLGQIITNLVNNAAIHGEPSLPIRVTLREENAHVVISVRNWGAPIPDELLGTIFDPFKQGPPSKRPHGAHGLGLGLYIVDRLTHSHGGTVSVESSAETGTVFRVRLPRVAHMASSPQESRLVVMIVDDDEDVRIGMAGLLEKRGYDVVTATDGLDALRQLRAGLRPSLILLDYSMPVMNGEQFCEEVASSPSLAGIPIVLVTGETADAVRLAEKHATALLTKPVPPQKLLEALQSVCG
jgi:signal transduction histidine kinase